jgi:hypothetical protein
MRWSIQDRQWSGPEVSGAGCDTAPRKDAFKQLSSLHIHGSSFLRWQAPINNYHVMHGRTAYADNAAEGRVRHLKRLWLETSVLVERPPYFENSFDSHWNAKRVASRMRVN